LDIIRKGLNEIKTHPKDEDPFEYPMAPVCEEISITELIGINKRGSLYCC
jgi:hypothetical protein